MIEPAKPTSVWWWLPPRDGELVPDYPPSEITDCVASVSFVGEERDDPQAEQEIGGES